MSFAAKRKKKKKKSSNRIPDKQVPHTLLQKLKPDLPLNLLADHSLRRSLETQQCKQPLKLEHAQLAPPKGVQVPLLSFSLWSQYRTVN